MDIPLVVLGACMLFGSSMNRIVNVIKDKESSSSLYITNILIQLASTLCIIYGVG